MPFTSIFRHQEQGSPVSFNKYFYQLNNSNINKIISIQSLYRHALITNGKPCSLMTKNNLVSDRVYFLLKQISTK